MTRPVANQDQDQDQDTAADVVGGRELKAVDGEDGAGAHSDVAYQCCGHAATEGCDLSKDKIAEPEERQSGSGCVQSPAHRPSDEPSAEEGSPMASPKSPQVVHRGRAARAAHGRGGLVGLDCRGSVIGTLQAGLTGGILLARAFGDVLDERLGWRAPYLIAATPDPCSPLSAVPPPPSTSPAVQDRCSTLPADALRMLRDERQLRRPVFCRTTLFDVGYRGPPMIGCFPGYPPFMWGQDAGREALSIRPDKPIDIIREAFHSTCTSAR